MTDHRAAPAETKNGGRVELRLCQRDSTDDTAIYDARWLVDEETLDGRAEVTRAREVTITADGASPPDWLIDFTRALLRTEVQKIAGAPFPRRLTRWRKVPARSE